jgi:ATP-dependent Clp endopeptidase proteolytic subunit ClpP
VAGAAGAPFASEQTYRFHGHNKPQRIVNELPVGPVENGVATLRLYDPIDSWGGEWGVSAKEFTAAVDALPADVTTIELHLNSPGGEVFEGIAILNALRNHKAKVVAVVDGIAASAASFIACGADELVMGQNAELMIHDARGVCMGNAGDMQAMTDLLNHLSDNIARVYTAKAGGTMDDWRKAMLTETWFSAEEAVAAGLADRVEGDAEQPTNTFDLSVFNHAGRAKAPAPDVTPRPHNASDDDENTLIAAVDASIDGALAAHADGDDETAWSLVTAADSTIDELMKLRGIPDPDEQDEPATTGETARLRHRMNARRNGFAA